MPGSIHTTIVTPEEAVLDTRASYVSIPAHDGQVGIAPRRAPLLAKLGFGSLRIEGEGGEREFFIGGGFAQVLDDELTILTDEAVPVEEINKVEAQAALDEALAYKGTGEAEVRQRRRDMERARAMLRAAK